jgi:mono/diheme cytochrome c family protein
MSHPTPLWDDAMYRLSALPTRILLALCCLCLPALVLTRASSPEPQAPKDDTKQDAGKVDFAKDVVPFLEKHCTGCHGGKKPKGALDLTKFKDETTAGKSKHIWDKVVANLKSGDMPPPFKARPPMDQVERLTKWMETTLLAFDCGKERDPGRVTIRRLNRNEYNNTIRDLLGIKFKPADDFPSDDVGYGFDNIGDVLTMSPLLMEKYFNAADKIVDEVFQTPALKKKIMSQKVDAQASAKDKQQAAQAILRPFIFRAYRRPPIPDELTRLGRFIDLAEKNGDDFEKGIQLAMKAALCSPHFLFRVEKDFKIQGEKFAEPISPFELASRLSYFLWSSMPDEELFETAKQGKLRDKAVLDKQVQRMLQDPKARALTENFAGQWLQLRSVAQLSPDPKLFPDFDDKLRAAMIKETELFFEHLLKEDRSILEFLDADWTFVNERLARHYGMPGVKGEQFVKVKLTAPDRLGVLTHASILSVTSNPTRTSPVKRGKWILDNILNTPPPPPPPDVPDLSEDSKVVASASLRTRMEQHRVNPNCAVCHQRMDPIGFGFENFDAVGAWRKKDGKFDVDASGELPTGQKFKGPKELVAVLKTKEAEFRRCLIEKLLTYALGRGLEYYDKCALDEISAEAVRNDNRFVSIVLAIVQSEPFQMKKGRPQ